MSTTPVTPRVSSSTQPSSVSPATLTSAKSGQPSSFTRSNRYADRGSIPSNHALPKTASPSARRSPQDLLRARSRRAGGFLLPSPLKNASPGSEKHDASPSAGSEPKGKARASFGSNQPLNHTSVGNGHVRTPRSSIENPEGHVATSEPRPSEESLDSPRQGSPFARAPSSRYSSHQVPELHQNASMDASQIVAMALNLSEGRRRHMSGQPLPNSRPGGGHRIVSTGAPVLQATYSQGAGGTLRKHLHDQRRVSRSITPTLGRSSPGPRHPSYTFTASEMDPSIQYSLSPATLARAEKVRQYFELHEEYLRLLPSLPPLKPKSREDAQKPRTGAKPGSDFVLGRDYNPLQLIRNRKARARARVPLEPPVERWEEPAAVREWVDNVEYASLKPQYFREDEVMLPRYPPRHYGQLEFRDIAQAQSEPPAGTRKAHPRLDWFISPSELLADAYWLEQSFHKTLIEDRYGDKMFSTMRSFQGERMSFESRRSHQDSNKHSAGSEKAAESDGESHLERRGRRQTVSQEHATHETSGKLKQVWNIARGRSRSASSGVSQSDSERRPKRAKLRRTSEYLNTGPLERHLNTILSEQHLPPQRSPELISPGTPNKWGMEQKNIAELERADTKQPCENESHKRRQSTELQQSKHHTMPHDGRASIDGVPTLPATDATMQKRVTGPVSQNAGNQSPSRNPIRHLIPFVRADPKDGKRVDSGSTNHDDSNRSSRRQSEEQKSARTSLELHGSPVQNKGLFSPRTNESLTSGSIRPASRGRDGKDGRQEPDSAVRRFFKGSRIGDVWRGENSKVGGLRRKRGLMYQDGHANVDADTEDTDESDTEDTSGTYGNRNGQTLDTKVRRTATADSEKSMSSHINTKDKARYRIELPSFKPAGSSIHGSRPTTPDEKPRRQAAIAQSPLRDGSLATEKIDGTGLEDSTTSLSLVPTYSSSINTTDPSNHHSRRKLLSRLHTRAHSYSANHHLAAVLDVPGVARLPNDDPLPPTALSSLRKSRSPSRSAPFDQQRVHDRGRHWSISDTHLPSRSPHRHGLSSTLSDIARVRAVLLCTGIKAATLARRAQEPRSSSAPLFLTDAARAANTPVPTPTPYGQEHMAAARLLTASLDVNIAALHTSANTLRTHVISPLHAALAALRTTVTECAEQARTAGDAAIGFGAVVTGQKTMEVRQVIDGLENFRRKRRRRLRWIRRVAFALLEWMLLLGMWWVWLVVIVFRTAWGVVRGVVRFARWAVWL